MEIDAGRKVGYSVEKQLPEVRTLEYERGHSLLKGTYRILRRIGEGGEGCVYLAMHERSCSLRAVKRVSMQHKQVTGAELRYWKHFSHTGLPQVYDIFEEEEGLFFVMEYIPGRTLREILDTEGRQSKAQVVEWGIRLCEVLSYLHNHSPSIIHGDLKPENIICTEEGRVVLLDFGTSVMCNEGAGVRKGTYPYAAPEVCDVQGEVCASSDIYSLGVVLSEMRMGALPEQVRVKGNLGRVLRKCMRSKPEERYENCIEMKKALCKVRRRRYRVCMICAWMAAVCLYFGHFLQSAKTYEEYLETNQVPNLRSAIILNPFREEAYEKLLQWTLVDNRMTVEEEESLRKLLSEVENEFKKNEKGYARFAYELGMAYWYYFEGDGGRIFAVTWFEKIQKEPYCDFLSREKCARLQVMTELEACCQALERRKIRGEEEFSFRELWNKLMSVKEAAQMEAEKDYTSLLMWNETISLIYDYLGEFCDSGVTKADIEEFMGEMESTLALENTRKYLNEAERKLKHSLLQKTELLRESMNYVYG